MEAHLRSIVHESLGLYVYPNAIFMAERLFAEFPSNENLHLVAHCYMQAGDAPTAYRLLAHHFPFGAVFQNTLKPSDPAWRCAYLYGVACAQTNRFQECERVLTELLQKDPQKDPATSAESTAISGVCYWLGVCARRLSRRSGGANFVAAVGANVNMFVAYESSVQYYDDTFAANPYKQALQGLPAGAAAPDGNGVKKSRSGARAAVSPVPIKPTVSAHPTATAADHESGVAPTLSMLRDFAEAAKALHCYRCKEATQLLAAPSLGAQRSSGWVILALALAAFHSGNYTEAVAKFNLLRAREPWRLNDPAIVLFSTALWHLRDEAALALLAQVLVEEMPMSPITMAVVANCYSLAKDPRLAVAMLQRATQLDPTHSYTHALKGHEYMALDLRQEAEAAFREAIRHDPRHYIAIAGLAELAFRQENDPKARTYFQQAMEINSIPAIINRFAATFHRETASTDSLSRALKIYEDSIARWPKNYAARHYHADILIRTRKYEQASVELEQLCEDMPEESQVHITLGKCLSAMGQTNRAVACYHRAMDLEPRRTTYIKGCLERLASGRMDDEGD